MYCLGCAVIQFQNLFDLFVNGVISDPFNDWYGAVFHTRWHECACATLFSANLFQVLGNPLLTWITYYLPSVKLHYYNLTNLWWILSKMKQKYGWKWFLSVVLLYLCHSVIFCPIPREGIPILGHSMEVLR